MANRTYAAKLTALFTTTMIFTSLTAGCGSDDGPHRGRHPDSSESSVSLPPDPGVEQQQANDFKCGPSQIWFYGHCRELDYFKKFLSEDATLTSVAGPQKKTAAADTGVIVQQALASTATQMLFILPTKRTALGVAGYLYRQDFPIVYMVHLHVVEG